MIRNVTTMRSRSSKVLLLASASAAVLAPQYAMAADTVVANGQTIAFVNNVSGADTITVEAGGTIKNINTNGVVQAINITGETTGTGVVITNSGTIESGRVGGSTVGSDNSRAINSAGDLTSRNITITNNAGAFIRSNNDAINIRTNTAGFSAGNSVIAITNRGTISSTSQNANGSLSNNQGIEIVNLGPDARVNILNSASGIIEGAQGVVVASYATVDNYGTIRAVPASGGTGEAIRLNGPYGNTITLRSGSTTIGTGANAVLFNGTGANVVNLEAGANVTGEIVANVTGTQDTLNLSGTGSATLATVNNFDTLNVLSGNWTSSQIQTLQTGGAMISSGASFTLADGGALRGAIVNNGTLNYSGATTLNQSSGGVAAPMSGTGSFNITGGGTYSATVANTYSGTTTVSNGTLRGEAANVLSANSAVVLGDLGTLNLNDPGVAAYDQTIAGLSGSGLVLLGATNPATLTFGANNASTTFSGVFSQSGNAAKVGTGALTLSGNSTATGALNVSGGNLLLSGGWAGALNLTSGGSHDISGTVGGPVTVTGGTLSLSGTTAGDMSLGGGASLLGGGTIGGVLTVADATLNPGGATSIGTLTTGGLVLGANSVLSLDLGAPGAAPSGPGTGDRITVNGAVTLDGTLNARNAGSFGNGVYRLIDYTGALTDNGLNVGALPAGTGAIQLSQANQVNLVVSNAVSDIQFWDGANTSPNGLIDGGSGSWTNATTNWTGMNGALNSAWGGKFAVFQGAAGTVAINDAIAFEGMQFITNGYTLAGGTGSLTISGASANLRVDPSNTATISAAIGGSGGIVKNDTGTLVLSGANTYTGPTSVAFGTLRVSGGNAIANSGAVSVASGATFDVASSETVGSISGAGNITLSGGSLTTGGLNASNTFSGVISGAGGLTKTGTGTLTLSGANTLTGTTSVTGGTLALTGSLGGAANVSGGAALTGNGSVAGTLTVANGTINPGTVGTIGVLTTGGLVLGSNSILNYDLGTAGPAPSGPGTGDRIVVNGSLVLDGTINAADAGGFGAGVYRLIDYTGSLTDNGLVVGTLASASFNGTVQTSQANQINLVVASNIPDIQFWDGANTAANGAIDGGSGTWNATNSNWTDMNGAFNAAWGGKFAVFQGTAGTVTLGSALTFQGMQFLTDGYTIAPGTGSLVITDPAALLRVTGTGTAATIGAAITGSGGIRKTDTGTLVLSGTNTYAGATDVASGTLRVTGGSAITDTSAVSVASGATFDVAASETVGGISGAGNILLSGGTLTTGGLNASNTFSGAIAGSGGLTKVGTGTLTLSGANTWSGATAINAGTVSGKVGTGDLTVATGATFNQNGTSNAVGALSGGGSILLGANTLSAGGTANSTFSGVISGSGGLTKTGTGTLTLGGNNTYTGLTTVNAGTLTLGSGTALAPNSAVSIAAAGRLGLGGNTTLASLNGAGSVTLGTSTLTVGTGTYSGVISGTGALTKTGTGTLTLTGVNTYTGATAVNAGLLVVNGSLTSAVTVASGAVLGGTGRVGGLTIAGTLAPGNSIGTMNVTGPVTLGANSIYQVEVAPNGTSDRLAATGAVTIQGGTVQVLATGTAYNPLTAYTIVTGSSVTGEFSGLTTNLAFLTPTLVYNPSSVQLLLRRNDFSFDSVAQSPNQAVVANAFDDAPTTSILFQQVVNASADQARVIFDGLSGEVHASGLAMFNRNASQDRRPVVERLFAPVTQGVQIWGDVAALSRLDNARDGYLASDSRYFGIAAGAELGLADSAKLGVAINRGSDSPTLDGIGGSADLNATNLFAYGAFSVGRISARVGAGYGWLKAETDRRFAAPTMADQLSASEEGDQTQVFGELAWNMGEGDTRIEPFIGAAWARTSLEGTAEDGDLASLTVAAGEYSTTLGTFGVRFSAPVSTLGGAPLMLDAEVAGDHYFDGSRAFRTVTLDSTGATYTVGANRLSNDAARLRFGFSAKVLGGDIGLAALGTISESQTEYGARIRGAWAF